MCILIALSCIWVFFLVLSLRATKVLISNAVTLDIMQVFIDNERLGFDQYTDSFTIQQNDNDCSSPKIINVQELSEDEIFTVED